MGGIISIAIMGENKSQKFWAPGDLKKEGTEGISRSRSNCSFVFKDCHTKCLLFWVSASTVPCYVFAYHVSMLCLKSYWLYPKKHFWKQTQLIYFVNCTSHDNTLFQMDLLNSVCSVNKWNKPFKKDLGFFCLLRLGHIKYWGSGEWGQQANHLS